MKDIVKILIILGIAIVLTQTCNKQEHVFVSSTTDTVYVHKTDTIFQTTYIPNFYEVEQYVYDTVTLTDTVFILKEYKEVRVYKDTIRDTSFIVYLTDTITQNRIVSRTYAGQSFYTEKTVHTETIIDKKSNLRFVAGPTLLYEDYLMPGIILGVHKNNRSAQLLYNPNIIGIQLVWYW